MNNIILAADDLMAALSSGKYRYKKEIIKIGHYVDSNDNTFDVDMKTLKHWAAQYALMSNNGVKVPIPLDHSFDADQNRGWVTNMYVEDNSLYAELEMIGEDAAIEAERNDVSIYSPKKLKDGHGNTYRQPITHVALTSYPLVQGLKEMEVMASLKDTVLLKLGEDFMDFKQIQAHLGIEEEITSDNYNDLICSAYDNRAKETVEVEVIKEVEVVKEIEIKADNKLDGDVIDLIKQNTELKLDNLIKSNCITKAVADKIKGLADAIEFSNQNTNIKEILNILEDNRLVDVKEYSGPQILELAHSTKENKLSMSDWVDNKYNKK